MANRSRKAAAPPPAIGPPTLLGLRDFAETVGLMRRMQQSYFETRSPAVLAKAKQLEKTVDELTQNILGAPRQPTATTPPLFDD